MTLSQAIEWAREESKGGFVQHVNRIDPLVADPRYVAKGGDPAEGDYLVSDWFDSDTTVKSFENGKEV